MAVGVVDGDRCVCSCCRLSWLWTAVVVGWMRSGVVVVEHLFFIFTLVCNLLYQQFDSTKRRNLDILILKDDKIRKKKEN